MMTREQRAKQFMPFDAMKGLKEALKEREERHSRVDKREISEEDREANATVLAKVVKGDKISVSYYCRFHNVCRSETVTAISFGYKYLVLDEGKIFFDDIYTISICE